MIFEGSEIMRYIKVDNANKIINNSSYLISNPTEYKNKWRDLFGNNKPICLELGTGRGNFIINMAKEYPNINFIGLEICDSQLVEAVQKLEHLKLNNLNMYSFIYIFYPLFPNFQVRTADCVTRTEFVFHTLFP